MSLIVLNNMSLSFCQKTIFDKVGVQINNGDRIGLVGPNGTGKTTLLRILIGDASPDEGEVSRSRGIRIGYLPQDISRMPKGTLYASVLNSIPGRLERDERLKKLEIDLEREQDPDRQTALAHKMADLHHEIDYYNTRFSPHRAEQILLGLGFSAESFDAPLNELSGGWKMRAALAGLLFQEPDVLLLDEPTNHLDIPSVLWLEEFLLSFNHSLVLICHDRKFLNRQINRVISLEPEGLRSYTGNYDTYLATRLEEESVLEKQARNQEQKVKEAKRFIERFRSKATKARQAQSKIKMLKKQEIVKTYKKRKVMCFSFPEVPRSGDVVLSIRGLTKSFSGRHLYQDLNLAVKRGERIAVIGKNGAGKTTLLKMIAGELSPDRGTINFGHNVTMGHYAQHHTELLNRNNTILEEVSQIVPNAGTGFVRGVCGAFLFPGDDVEKPISILSGGEKARVALARLLVKPGNLMLMDEPTNHLDLLSSEVLAKALREYSGTLVFVSHNQSLINCLATKIWDVSDQKVEEYPGNLEEYIDHLNRNKDMLQEEAGGKNSAKSGTKTDDGDRKTAKEQRRIKAERRKFVSQKLDPIKKELARLEQRIDELEKREKTVSGELSDPEIYQDIQQSKPLMIEYSKVKNELGELLKKWEYQQEMLETTQQEL